MSRESALAPHFFQRRCWKLRQEAPVWSWVASPRAAMPVQTDKRRLSRGGRYIPSAQKSAPEYDSIRQGAGVTYRRRRARIEPCCCCSSGRCHCMRRAAGPRRRLRAATFARIRQGKLCQLYTGMPGLGTSGQDASFPGTRSGSSPTCCERSGACPSLKYACRVCQSFFRKCPRARTCCLHHLRGWRSRQ